MTYQMKQCLLANGNQMTTAWIPIKFAVVNKNLRIKDLDGIWRVITVGDNSKTNNEIDTRSQDYKNQRKASDI